mmetsp:Transcript_34337/g.91838  ORF Transcript_34337/g.91838 Transcript_34337/m.91838 type:complete len:92 (+) Transcript_34337:1910-2185(+)
MLAIRNDFVPWHVARQALARKFAGNVPFGPVPLENIEKNPAGQRPKSHRRNARQQSLFGTLTVAHEHASGRAPRPESALRVRRWESARFCW